jgi:hypothetical protein
MTISTTITGKRIRLRRKKPEPKPLPEGVKKRRVNICLSPHWHKVGKEKAAARRLSFSECLEELIYRDTLHNESG